MKRGDKKGLTRKVFVFLILLIIPLVSASISVKSPEGIYNITKVPLYLESDTKGNFYLIKNLDSTDGVILCKNALFCRSLIKSNEDENFFWIKETYFGEEQYSDKINYFVDSVKPKFFSSTPKKYTNGRNITISYTEKNLNKIVLNYLANNSINILSNYNCSSGERQSCSFENISLDSEDKTEIWFTLTDYSGNYITTNHQTVLIDIIPPKMEINYSIKDRNINFNINVSEANLKNLRYIDYSDCYSFGMKEGILCTKLNVNKKCISKKSLCIGFHKIEVIAEDLAGNINRKEFKNIEIDH